MKPCSCKEQLGTHVILHTKECENEALRKEFDGYTTVGNRLKAKGDKNKNQ